MNAAPRSPVVALALICAALPAWAQGAGAQGHPGPGTVPVGSFVGPVAAWSIGGGAAGLVGPLQESQGFSGSYSAGPTFYGNRIDCPSDNIAITNPVIGFVDCLTVTEGFGGAATIGGRQALSVYGTLIAPTNSANTNRNYVAVNSTSVANTSDGGLAASTTLTSTASASVSTANVTVSATAGISPADLGRLQLDNGTAIGTTVSAASGTTLTLRGTLPSATDISNFFIDDTSGTRVQVNGSTAGSGTTALSVASIAGFTSGDIAALVLDTGQVYSSTVSGAPSGATVTIAGSLPSQASSGAKLYDLAVSSGTSKGALFAYGAATQLSLGAGGFTNITGGEFNVAAPSGSSVNYKSGLQVVLASNDAVRGTTYDCAICVSNKSPISQFHNGIMFGPMNGFFPVDRLGTLITTNGSHIYGTGIDFSTSTFNTAAVKTPGFTVSPTGGITATLPASAGGGGLFVCMDSAGVMYTKSTCP